MTTIGWLFVLGGLLIARQVSRGRVMNITADLGDAFIAVASGDTDALGEVLSRTGDSTTVDQATTPVLPAATSTANQAIAIAEGVNLANVAQKLGSSAKGYRWTATGPDYYDCSGLMWRACRAVGYTGARFTTANVAMLKAFKKVDVPGMQGPGFVAAVAGDLVVWPGHHMGVITGPDAFYSARSVRSGIGTSKISTFRKSKPIYLRYMPERKATNPFG